MQNVGEQHVNVLPLTIHSLKNETEHLSLLQSFKNNSQLPLWTYGSGLFVFAHPQIHPWVPSACYLSDTQYLVNK